MSSLIKASSGPAGSVMPFAKPLVGQAPNEPSREQLLEARVAALEAEIAEASEGLPQLLEIARKDGAREALKSRSDVDEKKLEQLGIGISKAIANWAERLASLEGFSATITRSVLEAVFADSTDRCRAIESALRRRLDHLDAQSIVQVRVSSEDFSSAEALEVLTTELGAKLSIVGDPKLKSGECVLDLKLGHMDVGPAGQWLRIAQFLDRLEREGL